MKKTAKAYGKVNLCLEITGLLPNGYHSLETVMQSVSLYNRITVARTQSGCITLASNDKALPTDRKNTAYRAAELFLSEIGADPNIGLDIFIEKNVPYQAGMGSASADAAGVLAAANEIFDNAVSRNRLLEISAKIGADVPFCLVGGTALAQGIGEKLTTLPSSDFALLIMHPNKSMSTPEAYRRFDALEAPVQPDCSLCADAVRGGLLSEIAKSCGNVFELCCDISEVFEIKKALLKSGALSACMTGSGTAVFGIFETVEKAESAQAAINRPDWRSWGVTPINIGVEIE